MNPDFRYDNAIFLKKQIESKTAPFNYELKFIARLAGIEEKLTTHCARHTFADMARKNGVDLHTLKGMLGHSSLGVTEAYLKELDTEAGDTALEQTFRNL